MMKVKYAVVLQFIIVILCDASKHKNASKINEKKPSAKYDNPNFVRDRCKNEIFKPDMPALFKERHRKPFNPGWMDYCDPYHCNDYHKTACGLNRKTMRFRWFQSACHLILNNQCANFRGNLKYDLVDTKFCTLYVKYLRTGCPSACHGTRPVCGVGAHNDLVLFRSRCALDMLNCRRGMYAYEEVDMFMCVNYINTLDR